MKVRPLILGADERFAIRRVIAHAEANPLSMEQLQQMIAGEKPPVGDDPAFACVVPFGYRCVFSLEQQPGFMARHLSVSVNTPGLAPHSVAVEMLAREFGFRGGLKDMTAIWEEPFAPGRTAVNIIQRKDE